MKKQKSRSTFSLGNKTFTEILLDNFDTKYEIELPHNGIYEKCFETTSLLEALDYCYGVGKFIIKNDKCFYIEFDPDKYSDKDVKRAGYFEPFDFLTHNILTAYELDQWKVRIRNSMEF